MDDSSKSDAKPLKGGMIRIDPLIYGILHPKPEAQTETIRKDAIFKSIANCSNPAYVVTPVDPNQAVDAEQASSFTLIK